MVAASSLFAFVDEGLPASVTLILVMPDIGIWPIWERLLQNGNDDLGIGFLSYAADLKTEDIMKEINRTEVLEPVELVRRETLER